MGYLMKLNTLYYNPLNLVYSFIYLHMEIEKKKSDINVGASKQQEFFFSNRWKLVKIELNFLKVKMVVKLRTKKSRNPQICTKINVRAFYFLCCNCKDVNQRHVSKSFSPANYDSQCGWIYFRVAIEICVS